MVIANCEIDIPVSVVEGLRGDLFKKKGFGIGSKIKPAFSALNSFK